VCAAGQQRSAAELSFTGEWQKKDWPDEHTQDATERGTFVLALHGPEEVVGTGSALTLITRLPLTQSLENSSNSDEIHGKG
jgi:hypothetical protein